MQHCICLCCCLRFKVQQLSDGTRSPVSVRHPKRIPNSILNVINFTFLSHLTTLLIIFLTIIVKLEFATLKFLPHFREKEKKMGMQLPAQVAILMKLIMKLLAAPISVVAAQADRRIGYYCQFLEISPLLDSMYISLSSLYAYYCLFGVNEYSDS